MQRTFSEYAQGQEEQQQEQQQHSSSSSDTNKKAKQQPKYLLKTSSLQYTDKFRVSSLADVSAMLDRHGVAVVPSALSPDEVSDMNTGMWHTLEHCTAKFGQPSANGKFGVGGPELKPISRDDPATWKSFEQLLPSHRMLVQHWGIGHARYVWRARAAPGVREAFAAVHGTEDLVVSYDGVSIYLPYPEGRPYRGGENLWLHTDERFAYTKGNPQRRVVQGWVTGYDVQPGCATLAVLEGSHRHHAEFGVRFGLSESHKKNWYKLEGMAQHQFFMVEKGCALRGVTCQAGDLVLWDSRTIHCGAGPPSGDQRQPRNVVYICMTPKAWCSEKVLEKRRNIFHARRMTPHTPHAPTMFGLLPQTYGLKVYAPTTPHPRSGIHCPPPWYGGELPPIQNAPTFEDGQTGVTAVTGDPNAGMSAMTADIKRLVPM